MFSDIGSSHLHKLFHLLGDLYPAVSTIGALCPGKVVEGWFPLLTRRKTRKGEVRMRLQLTPVERLPMYCQGLGPGGRYGAVLQTYFPLRRGCRVTLYQNASVATDEEVSLR